MHSDRRKGDRHSPAAKARKRLRAKERYACDSAYRNRTLEAQKQSYSKEKRYAGAVKRLYNISPVEYAEMYHRQRGACACCYEPLLGGRRQHLDHCHETGTVRGILCARCNLLTGWRERPDTAWAIIDTYLARFK